MITEKFLNDYYNKAGLNKPVRIGYIMKLIRKLKPLTEEEWKNWYLEKVHNEQYLENLAKEMQQSIPSSYNISLEVCRDYIYKVMFYRTFLGYNKEKSALQILQKEIAPEVQEASAEWDTKYFIDFYVKGPTGKLVGIQLKPDTFYKGNYQTVVDIDGKMKAFCQTYKAKAYVLTYKQNLSTGIEFTNPQIIDKIKQEII
jgi:hypothetical protein